MNDPHERGRRDGGVARPGAGAHSAGERSWDDVMMLRTEWRSLPSGLLQDWHDGACVSASWNREDAPLEAARFFSLYSGVLGALWSQR